ncbi:Uncharacterised protein [Vibrio cholerae]|nr:Uncharacterised protein [Vibrio cholerae]CSI30679.1 Uncharacterised protein [Vibrio cholerae]
MHIPRVVHRFKRHTGGDRAIANHTDHFTVFTFFTSTDCHAECGTDRGGGVTHREGVVFTLFTPWERV